MIIALPFSWVTFEEPGFCGETYILEKGLYGCQEDWGALQPRVASAMPVVLVRDSHEYIRNAAMLSCIIRRVIRR